MPRLSTMIEQEMVSSPQVGLTNIGVLEPRSGHQLARDLFGHRAPEQPFDFLEASQFVLKLGKRVGELDDL